VGTQALSTPLLMAPAKAGIDFETLFRLIGDSVMSAANDINGEHIAIMRTARDMFIAKTPRN
jgi:hypothetical protein